MANRKQDLKILLVEDQPIVMQVHTKMLEDLGYRPDGAETAAAALAAAAAKSYDVIFMDIGLPDGNGIDVTRQIMMQSSQHQPMVVGITAYLVDDVRDQCLASGMQQVLNKPVRYQTLDDILIRHLQPHVA